MRPRAGLSIVRSLIRRKPALVAALMLTGFTFVALAAPLLSPHAPDEINLRDRMTPPGILDRNAQEASPYLLGTDSLGRDVLSRVIYGSRVSLSVGFAAVIVSGCLGTTLGLLAGFHQGRTDQVLARIMDIQLAFPSIILAIAAIAFIGPGIGNLIVVLGVAGWVVYARVVRAETLSLRTREYVEAARIVGGSTSRIIFRHILPNITAPILVIASFSVASTIVAEASLSFLGLGVPPDVPSWGGMLAEGREFLDDAWWLSTFPGLAIVAVVLSINVLGDWLRDYLDPRLGS